MSSVITKANDTITKIKCGAKACKTFPKDVGMNTKFFFIYSYFEIHNQEIKVTKKT
jgi:hypothetical protein